MEPAQYVAIQFFFQSLARFLGIQIVKLKNGEKAQKKFTITVVQQVNFIHTQMKNFAETKFSGKHH